MIIAKELLDQAVQADSQGHDKEVQCLAALQEHKMAQTLLLDR